LGNLAHKIANHPHHSLWQPEESLDLITTRFPAQTPLAEVLTIVGQQSIAVLADARTCAANDFFSVKVRGRATPHPQGPSRGEKCERNFFYRTATQTCGATTIMHDFALTDVDAMVKIAAASRNHMRP
jgi:hypothetical protein